MYPPIVLWHFRPPRRS